MTEEFITPPPVLLVIFNRPEHAAQTFARIRASRPAKLFIHADGPRVSRPGEDKRCLLARQATEEIDWPCEVHRLYRDQNLGCGPGVSSAITWFFEHVEEGIILEDDCLPHPAFFTFCALMLSRHRDNDRIMHVAGSGLALDSVASPTIHLLPFPLIWGWATWRRAWSHYQFKLPSESEVEATIRHYNHTASERSYWRTTFIATRTGAINTWDYQWVLALWRQGGLAVTPSFGLVSNEGLGVDATHTQGINSTTIAPLLESLSLPSDLELTTNSAAVNMGYINRHLLQVIPSTWDFRFQSFARKTSWTWRLYLALRSRLRPLLCRH
ncbi:hypothetical protein [Rariglobus hedericola]|uniref:Nucleotide-diphospho-sugar transferase n=1 Tax=Rariglobus hedericola TaxID=2597822 RepID=A0A556QPV9_9BACT|nr:hypothetical protein [Rariglobus hedericola]TSJ78680.1 hypothetical protein FPL22_05075 [Rariglobus hedericola]